MVRKGVVKPTIPRKWLGTKLFARVESERARSDHRNRIRVIVAEGVWGRENRLEPHVSSTARPAIDARSVWMQFFVNGVGAMWIDTLDGVDPPI
jgi:hypothetical protein